jgi:hypothetical protein
VELLVVVVE